MPRLFRFTLTLSDSSYGDREIISYMDRFGSGKGKQERSFEIKRLLRAALEQESIARNFGGSPFVSRTIRPTLLTEDITPVTQNIQEGPAFPIGKLKPSPAVHVVVPGRSDELPSKRQDAESAINGKGDGAGDGLTSANPFPAALPAKAAVPTDMLGFLMEALAAGDKQNPI